MSQIDQPQRPNNFLPLAIVSTILGCCSPLFSGFIVGIVAIVFSTQVNSKFLREDFIGAEKSAKVAKILSFVAFGLIAIGIINLIVTINKLGWDNILQQYQMILDQVGYEL